MKGPAATQLGKDGPWISRIGMGCYQLGGHGWGEYEEEDAIAAIKKAIDMGVTFFDTADVYGLGRSELLLGSIVAGRENEVTVATKGGVAWDEQKRTRKDSTPDYLRFAVEQSLRRLGTEVIDLYYLHWKDGITPLSESVGELFSLRKEGKIRQVGLSNVSAEDLTLVAHMGDIDAVQIQANILHHTSVHELAAVCQETQTTLVTWGSLADGLLTGKYNTSSFFGDNDHRFRSPDFQGKNFLANLKVVEKLRPVAQAHQATVAQLALRWVLDMFDSSVALFGAKNPQQVLDCLQAKELRLTEEECSYIAALSAK